MSEFRADIEGLRGVAILFVVLFHCDLLFFRGGFVGVDVFFVLSGYLITGLLVREFEEKSRVDLLTFYARRVRRLLPASSLMLVVTLGVAAVLMVPHEIISAGRAAGATSLYASNVFFAFESGDYFARGTGGNPMLHTWSLAVEEQFYLIWPLLIALGLRVYKSRRALLGVLGGLTVASLFAGVWLTRHYPAFAFYGLPAGAWEFGIGGLVGIVPLGAHRISGPAWGALGWIGVLTVLASAPLIKSGAAFPGWIALLPCCGAAIALTAGAAHPGSGCRRLLGCPPLQFLGKLSYSWYLWHWPFLVFAVALIPTPSLWVKPVAAAGALLVASIAYRFIEHPVRFNAYLMKHPAITLACAAGVTLSTFTASILLAHIGATFASTPALSAVEKSAKDVSELPRACITAAGSADVQVKSCAFGSISSPNSIALFGDSHAIHWFNAVNGVAHARGWKLVPIVKSYCPAVDFVGIEGVPSDDAACAAWRAAAIRRIVAMEPSLVLVASANTYLRNYKAFWRRGILDRWRYGAAATLRSLSATGVPIVMIRDVPNLGFDVPTCVERAAWRPWYPVNACGMAEADAADPAIFEAEKRAAQGIPNVTFVDMNDQVCPSGWCNALLNGTLVYRDGDHLTGAFSSGLAQVLASRLPL